MATSSSAFFRQRHPVTIQRSDNTSPRQLVSSHQKSSDDLSDAK